MDRLNDCSQARSNLVAPLKCFSQTDVERAGGKAANLGELIQANFPVPDGFVITTAAYDQFVSLSHLDEHAALNSVVEPGRSEEIRAAFEAAPMPAGIQQPILEAFRQLGAGPVAVRSSATAEDLPEAAFAGQQDTFLNVVGETALLDAVRRCWASLWTERAISYRKRQGLGGQAVKLAVVVQCLVAAETAGVMFTANPVTGDRDEVVIDASPGLGEAVVSGLVTPDHFVVRRRRRVWRVVARQAGRREIMVRPKVGGSTEQVKGQVSGKLTLPDKDLFNLAKVGEAIARHFGQPQDIEWAMAGGELFILQARPITALPEHLPEPNQLVKMLSAMFAEMFPLRPYPLDETTWVEAISSAAVTPIFSLLGIAVPPLSRFFTKKEGVMVTFKGSLPLRLTPGVLLASWRFLYLSLRYDPRKWRSDPLLAEARLQAKALEAVDLKKLSWKRLLHLVHEALGLALPLAGVIRRRYFPRAILAAGMLRVGLGLLGRGKYFSPLLSGTQSQTSAANEALEKLALGVRSDPTLRNIFSSLPPGELEGALEENPAGQVFLVELRAFLQQYGHREVVLSSVLQPTWKDDPRLVFALLKGLAQTPPPAHTGMPAYEAARVALLAHPLLKVSPLRAAFLNLLSTARCFFQIREDTHFEATRILPILRRTFLEMGQRLVQKGALDQPEDIFHLELAELEAVKEPPDHETIRNLQAKVRRRKEIRLSVERTPLIEPRLYQQGVSGENILLKGTPGSPGVAEGPVCVILSATDFGKLHTGEVLVAPFTNPSWTPLFQRAAAVVVDGGAAGSHAAIVAREYGIPAVMGTVTGTQTLRDGDWVRVDGLHGVVLPARSRLI